ncbi:cpt_6 [Blepharisma stoltei]|uniref:Peptidase M14 domain-containing protein n=1 Tax=Blepharisma stoltei TaxID=1481888 RepID=A0AAU9K9H7_9CILI|nr:unnamed protein product [Blepharisma stoltei]
MRFAWVFIVVSYLRIHSVYSEGSLGGFYSLSDIYEITSNITQYSAQYLSSKTIDTNTAIESDNPIVAIRWIFNKNIDSQYHRAIVISAEQYTSQPLSTSMVFYLLDLLRGSNDTKVNYLSETKEIWFLPALNPDALKYVGSIYKTGSNIISRYKNVEVNSCENSTEQGTNLNRNYDAAWEIINPGSSTDPCSDNYKGEKAFSARETQAVKSFLESVADRLDLWIHFDDYGDKYYCPYTQKYGTSAQFFQNTSWEYILDGIKKQTSLIPASVGSYYETNNSTQNGALIDYVYTYTNKSALALEIAIGPKNPSESIIKDTLEAHVPAIIDLMINSGYYLDLKFERVNSQDCTDDLTVCKNGIANKTWVFELSLINPGIRWAPTSKLTLSFNISGTNSSIVVEPGLYSVLNQELFSDGSNSSYSINQTSTNSSMILDLESFPPYHSAYLKLCLDQINPPYSDSSSNVTISYSIQLSANYGGYYYSLASPLNGSLYLNSEINSKSDNDESSSNDSLSGGAIAGIVIGIIAFFFLIIGGIFIYKKLRKPTLSTQLTLDGNCTALDGGISKDPDQKGGFTPVQI